MVIIPLTLLTYLGDYNGKYCIFLSLVGHYSLFPLLFPKELTLIKTFLYIAYAALSICGFKKLFNEKHIFNIVEKLYLLGFVSIYLYENVIHSLIKFDEKLPYLPLMLTSVYCSFGIITFWVKFYYKFLFSTHTISVNVNIVKKKVK